MRKTTLIVVAGMPLFTGCPFAFGPCPEPPAAIRYAPWDGEVADGGYLHDGRLDDVTCKDLCQSETQRSCRVIDAGLVDCDLVCV